MTNQTREPADDARGLEIVMAAFALQADQGDLDDVRCLFDESRERLDGLDYRPGPAGRWRLPALTTQAAV